MRSLFQPLVLAIALTSVGAATTALALPVRTPISYTVDGASFEGVLIHDSALQGQQPGIVLIPNWLGINEANLKQAELVAGTDYVVFVADMYGKEIRPANGQEAGKASGAVKGDRPLMRARINAALDQLRKADAPLDTSRVAAIGFCFGGTTALELARSGADVDAVVSFHGGLSSPTPADAQQIKARVLALHGADDPYVPAAEVAAFEQEMKDAKTVDWQLVSYGGAVHSFTDVDANAPGQAMYHERTAKRAYAAMRALFAEIW